MAAALLSEDDQRYLKAWIDHHRKQGDLPPLPPPGVEDDVPFYKPSFIGMVTEDLAAGPVSSTTVRFQPMFGPSHALTTQLCAAPFRPDNAWVAIVQDQWGAAYNINGQWHVTPVQCPPTET